MNTFEVFSRYWLYKTSYFSKVSDIQLVGALLAKPFRPSRSLRPWLLRVQQKNGPGMMNPEPMPVR